ncbi:HD domain-containing protein [Amycolatopsis vancoresmycina]|uniref:HD domain-containing protein n=1 Tax=Amycolatopsis vancoresmycina TaxID=208444 RepID=UPI0012DEF752|nr:HD domain-containing protein [Amycolatopsis vancoresmycina]
MNSDRTRASLLPGWLHSAASRLRDITGFITVYPHGGDQRTRAFSRYDHVARVTSLALSMANYRGVDRQEVLLLSWLHDINRWPFAHNSERGNFDQAHDIARFIAGRLPDRTVEQAVGVANKDIALLNDPAQIVLLADIVTGFIEDTLFTITGLNLTPSDLPTEALDLMRLPVGDATFLEELQYLHNSLNRDRDIPRYTQNFNSLVFRSAHRFLADHSFWNESVLQNERFWNIRRFLRDELLREHIFPLNNEKVCHGQLIRETLIAPLLDNLGRSASEHLTQWTEVDIFTYCLQHNLASDNTLIDLVPEIDYIQHNEPMRSFMQQLP